MNILKILVVVIFSISLEPSHAESNFNYDYVEVGFVSLDTRIFGVDADGDTLGISGSFDLSESVNFLAGSQSADYDFDLEGTQAIIGLGYHQATNRNTDLYMEAFYLDVELAFPEDIELEDAAETGYGVNVGLRNLIGRKFELDFSVSHVDLNGNQTGFGLAGRYYLHRTFALGLSISGADDTRGLGFALRAGF
jgi:hypothetical protein